MQQKLSIIYVATYFIPIPFKPDHNTILTIMQHKICIIYAATQITQVWWLHYLNPNAMEHLHNLCSHAEDS